MFKIGLIVNADDFGLTPGVNRGIIEAHEMGILTSASIMSNMPSFHDAVDLMSDHPRLELGVHINLSSGFPVSPAFKLGPLIGPDGQFRGVAGLMAAAWLPGVQKAIKIEIASQVAKVVNEGVRVTHLDGHKHVHIHPVILGAVMSIAKSYGIKAIRAPVEERSICAGLASAGGNGGTARVSMVTGLAKRARWLLKQAGFVVPDYFFGITRTGDWDSGSMAAAISRLKPGITEFMVHPGRIDNELEAQKTRLVESRLTELAALVDPDVKKSVQTTGAHLMNFSELVIETAKTKPGQEVFDGWFSRRGI
jgi:hopanoid biosynthesis associated protein HpnK